MIDKEKAISRTFYLALLVPLVLLPLFLQLGKLTIQLWDESRLAINALEMAAGGNWLVTTFYGEPDLWNTKPPLMIWMQAGLMRAIGYNEWAVRLPAALAGFAAVLLVFFFTKNHFRSLSITLASVMVLITSRGFVNTHVTRTGDYDALLVLWLTLSALFYYRYLQAWRPSLMYVFTAGLILAVYTKGIAGLMILPALLLYTLISGNLLTVLRKKELYLSIAAFIVLVAVYYVLRENQEPGYLKAVAENELGGRYFNVIEGHDKPWYFYFLGGTIFPWTVLLLPAGFLIFKRADEAKKQFALFCFLYVALYLFIISTAKTKLPWYDAPIYPFISLIVGIGLSEAFQWLAEHFQIKKRRQFGVLLFLLAFSVPYFLIVHRILRTPEKHNDPETQYGYLMRDLKSARPELTEYTILEKGGYNPSLAFYISGLNQEGYKVSAMQANNINAVPKGFVAVCDSAVLSQLKARYQLKVLHQKGPCVLLQLPSQP
jgi:4-amino-4-deoxy-L-arabinose transferase-like glycosyltransferase